MRQAELARLKSENKTLLADAKELEAEKDSLQVCVGGWVDGWVDSESCHTYEVVCRTYE